MSEWPVEGSLWEALFCHFTPSMCLRDRTPSWFPSETAAWREAQNLSLRRAGRRWLLGDKRTCGPLGRRGKNLSTMHSTLNETGAKLSVHDIQTLLFICTKSWAHGSRKLQCSEHDSPAHHLADTLEAVGEGSFSVRWALEAADSGTRLPMEWGGP